MQRARFCGSVVALILGAGNLVWAADDEPAMKIQWVRGPATGKLGTVAEIKLPEGYMFAGADDTRRLMEAMQNPSTGAELGFVSPTNMAWFVVFEYSESGYVKDDENILFAMAEYLLESRNPKSDIRKLLSRIVYKIPQ